MTDTEAGTRAAVNGDVSTLEWIRDRVPEALGPAGVARLDELLSEVRAEVADGRLHAAARTANTVRPLLG
jgi:hypothetical protein